MRRRSRSTSTTRGLPRGGCPPRSASGSSAPPPQPRDVQPQPDLGGDGREQLAVLGRVWLLRAPLPQRDQRDERLVLREDGDEQCIASVRGWSAVSSSDHFAIE